MPEVLEAPPKPAVEYIPPIPENKEPLKVKAGDKYRETFEKLTKAELPEAPKPEEKPKEEPKPELPAPQPEAKPTSPLDVVTADKKDAPKVEVEDEYDGLDEKNPDWKKARQLIKTRKQEVKTLTSTIADLKKAPKADPEQIAKLSKERDDLRQSLSEREELIKSVDVRLSDDYRTLAKKRDDTVQKIGDRARSYGVDGNALVAALALPESRYKAEQIEALLADVAPGYKTKLDVLVEKLDEHNEALNEYEKDAPKKYEEIQAKREAAQREQQEASIKAIQSEFGKISESLPSDVVTLREVPDDVPGGTEWNQAIKDARENALRILSPGGSDFKESAAVAYKGAHYDALMTMFLKDHTELTDARKRLAEYDSGGPEFKGGGKPKGEAKLTPAQKYHRAMEQGKSSQDD